MIKGVVKFLVIGSVSVGLMSIVVGSNARNAPLSKPHYFYDDASELQVDSPIVTKDDLPYKFDDNNGRQPIYDDKTELFLLKNNIYHKV